MRPFLACQRALPHPRQLLPRPEKEPTIPTTLLLGLREFASLPYPCRVDDLPTLPCLHAARLRMVGRRVVLALWPFPIHPPMLPRRRRPPRPQQLLPRPEKEPTILTTRLLGHQANASTHFPCQVDVLPTPPCWHAARQRMVDKLATFASPNFPIHPRRHLPRLHQPFTILTTHLLGLLANASPHFPCQADVLPMLPRQNVVRPHMPNSLVGLVWFRVVFSGTTYFLECTHN